MSANDFVITFEAPHGCNPLIRGFFMWLRGIKHQMSNDAGSVEERESFIRSPEWTKFINEEVISRLGTEGAWDPEDLIDCILSGEYLLVSLDFSDNQTGTLCYDPKAFPFGGTDALKGFVGLYGYTVTRDSFWDGYPDFVHRSD
ncbi:MAG: hypothetical protein EOP84_03575 [Verrucomicrobiaceae bacterium]|nr:MAG: hypothetical protein EOP84_03575 [Verrucomicrobiaceae bacterium]